jgi:hypothetical protein
MCQAKNMSVRAATRNLPMSSRFSRISARSLGFKGRWFCDHCKRGFDSFIVWLTHDCDGG